MQQEDSIAPEKYVKMNQILQRNNTYYKFTLMDRKHLQFLNFSFHLTEQENFEASVFLIGHHNYKLTNNSIRYRKFAVFGWKPQRFVREGNLRGAWAEGGSGDSVLV